MPINEDVFGSPSHVRLPPDSSGKRSAAFKSCYVSYTAGTQLPVVGDIVSGQTSGAKGTVVEISSDSTTTDGTLVLICAKDALGQIFTVGEDLYIDGGKVAECEDRLGIWTPATHTVGANNPHNAQFVDNKGSAYVRFDDGPQQLDGFGLSRYSTPSLVGFYPHHYNELDSEFWDDTVGTATLTHLPDEAAVALDIGTDSGDRYTRTSHKYHLYQTGYSQLTEMTVVCGDSGKANVRRRWGYYDDENGVYFELDGTQLALVLRSSASGSVVETRVLQADWNRDNVDGSNGLNNLSRKSLDITKLNVFWIDLQWLGAGRVRAGVLDKTGGRIVCHAFENANQNPTVYMKTATLPVRYEIENTGAAASPSRFKAVCLGVKTEGLLLPDRKKRTVKWGLVGAPHSISDDLEHPLLSFRSRQAFANGVVNRMVAIPELWSVWVEGAAIILRFYYDASLTGAVWNPYSTSSLELDSSATAISGGMMVMSHMY